jgi:uncharacterized membrane protein
MTEVPGAPPPTYPHPRIPDDAYRRMTLLLRGGLLASLGILLGALAGYLAAHPNQSINSVISSNPVLGYLSLGGLGHGLATGAPEAYLALGVFVLIATPVLRVAAGVYYFRRGGERTMTWITLTVLVLLVLGVLVIGPLIR